MAVDKCIRGNIAVLLTLLLWGGCALPSVTYAASLQKADVGFGHTLVIRDDGTVRAWGQNAQGQLGNGTTNKSSFPVASQIANVISVAAGHTHSVALLADGTVWVWGSNASGQLAQPNAISNSLIPIQVLQLSNVVSIVAGYNHTVALKNDGTVWTWGGNTYGQIANGSVDDQYNPSQVVLSGLVTDIATGGNHSYALLDNGTSWVWGENVHYDRKHGNFFLSPWQIVSWEKKYAKNANSVALTGYNGQATVISSLDNVVILKDDGSVLTSDTIAVDPASQSNTSLSQVVWSGALKVDIEPEAAVNSGVQWRIPGGEWLNSGEVLSGLVEGSYDIEFNDSYKWTVPAGQQVIISEGSLTTILVEALHKQGNLIVQMSPAAAVVDGAQWRLRGGEWLDSGAQVPVLPVGNYVIEFAGGPDWLLPQPQAVALKEQGALVDVVFFHKTGDLQVNVDPLGAVQNGAKWRLQGGSWNDSGTTLPDLPIGQYNIEYASAPGYEAAASQSVDLTEDGIVLTANYRQLLGDVEVNITPSGAVADGASWRIDGGAWQAAGTRLSGIPEGSHTIDFSTLGRWHTLTSQTIWVADQTTSVVSGDYTMRVGSLSVILNPTDAVMDGALWRIQGGSWRASGDVISSLPLGNYMIEFSDVAGWTTPTVHQISIAETRNLYSAEYVEIPGSFITVNIQPQNVVNMGAQWRVFGKGWLPSGTQSEALLSGAYTLEYAPMANWDAPASQTVILSHNDSQTINVQYTVAKSSHTLPVESVALDLAEMEAATVVTIDGTDVVGDLIAGDTQVYAFDAIEGRNYLMLLEGDNEGYISLYSEDGATLLARSSLSVSSGYGRVEWQAPHSGQFYAKVGYYDEIASGTHQLSILVDGVKSDFNNDGYSDILSRSAVTGDVHINYLSGTQVVGGGFLINQPGLTSDNKLEGVADFNGDGSSDLLWRSADNVFSIWFMDGLTMLPNSGATSRLMSNASDMKVVATGDLNGDGRDDILWQNMNNGRLNVWLMSGTTVLASSASLTIQPRGGASLWELAGTGDFNGDHKQDILWRNKLNGYSLVWFMDGVEVLSSSTSEFFNSGLTSIHEPAHSEWKVYSVADYSGDGVADILWLNAQSETVRIWNLNGRNIEHVSENLNVGVNQQIQAVADYNGDGIYDLLLRDVTDDTFYVMFMNAENTLPISTTLRDMPVDTAAREIFAK